MKQSKRPDRRQAAGPESAGRPASDFGGGRGAVGVSGIGGGAGGGHSGRGADLGSAGADSGGAGSIGALRPAYGSVHRRSDL